MNVESNDAIAIAALIGLKISRQFINQWKSKIKTQN